MNVSRKKLHHAVLTLFATSVSASLAAPALAQTPQSVNRIEVTGSAIKRIDGETALPVTVITREDIDRTGAVGTEDLLRRITSSTAMMSDTNQGVGYAVSNANLRGLGASSTLVLLNGRRLANHAFGSIGGFGGTPTAVDLNSIPFSAIERVEVLRDGASAIYGTDAVGGVINFITRSDYRGAEVSANYGRPEKNYGGTEQGATGVYGVGDLSKQGWNVLITGRVQYNKSVAAIDQKLYDRANSIPERPIRPRSARSRDASWTSASVPARTPARSRRAPRSRGATRTSPRCRSPALRHRATSASAAAASTRRTWTICPTATKVTCTAVTR